MTVQCGFHSVESFILQLELGLDEGSRAWIGSPQATILGGPEAKASSWLVSEYNLVTAEKTSSLVDL